MLDGNTKRPPAGGIADYRVRVRPGRVLDWT